jgi:hypothetical protein
MEEAFEIQPTDNDLVKKLVNKEHNFEMLVYYVDKLPSDIPDKFVFSFGYLDLPRPSGGHGVYAVFAIPDYDKVVPDRHFRHVIVINAMHFYITNEWNRLWFDEVAYSNGYLQQMFDQKANDDHREYLKRAENEIALKFFEWQNKHRLN